MELGKSIKRDCIYDLIIKKLEKNIRLYITSNVYMLTYAKIKQPMWSKIVSIARTIIDSTKWVHLKKI